MKIDPDVEQKANEAIARLRKDNKELEEKRRAEVIASFIKPERPFFAAGTRMRLRIPSKDDPEVFELFSGTIVGVAKPGEHRVYIVDGSEDEELVASLQAAGYDYTVFCMHETELEEEAPVAQ